MESSPEQEVVHRHAEIAKNVEVDDVFVKLNLDNPRSFVAPVILLGHYLSVLFVAKDDLDLFVGVKDLCQIHEDSKNGVGVAGSENDHVVAVIEECFFVCSGSGIDIAVRKKERVLRVMFEILKSDEAIH